MSSACTSSGNVSSSPRRNQGLREGAQDPFSLKLGEDDYTDDELDPAMQEELDRCHFKHNCFNLLLLQIII